MRNIPKTSLIGLNMQNGWSETCITAKHNWFVWARKTRFATWKRRFYLKNFHTENTLLRIQHTKQNPEQLRKGQYIVICWNGKKCEAAITLFVVFVAHLLQSEWTHILYCLSHSILFYCADTIIVNQPSHRNNSIIIIIITSLDENIHNSIHRINAFTILLMLIRFQFIFISSLKWH